MGWYGSMEQHIKRQINMLTEKAHRYWLLLERTRQDLEQQPDSSLLQMRVQVLEEDIDAVLLDIERMLRKLLSIEPAA
jgi:hypothetical protein